MYIRSRAWLRILIAGGCMLQLSSCVGDTDYFIVSTSATWITAKIVQLFMNALFA